MGFTEEIFKRATIRGVTEYLLYGASVKDSRSYDLRMKELYQLFDEKVKDYAGENTKLGDYINQSVSQISDVYTEIGLQAGFLIMMDMMKNIEFNEQIKTDEPQKTDYKKMYDSLFRDVSAALKLLQ